MLNQINTAYAAGLMNQACGFAATDACENDEDGGHPPMGSNI
jgi:hypothetical protein